MYVHRAYDNGQSSVNLSGQTKFDQTNLLYIINGEVNECIIGTNVWIIFNINHKQCVYIPFSEDFNMVSTSAVNIAFSFGLVASPCENATIASS